jgi:hypothetical protein
MLQYKPNFFNEEEYPLQAPPVQEARVVPAAYDATTQTVLEAPPSTPTTTQLSWQLAAFIEHNQAVNSSGTAARSMHPL